jgi:catechol-2,3-dioxygenase
MTDTGFQVDHIDHVALTVSDRYEAAGWYADVLGLEVCEEYESWADGNGPLVVSTDGGHTMLALFGGSPDGSDLRHLAFRTDGDSFLEFVDKLATRSDIDVGGRADVVDHDLSFSVYFSDPYDHQFEVTTYEYDRVAAER